MMAVPYPSALSKKRNWWIPLSPVMRVKKVRDCSISGWNPTNPPILGYISSMGSVAWPHPKVCTHRPASMLSAIRVAAFCILSICVSWILSCSSRTLSSHSIASIFILCFFKLSSIGHQKIKKCHYSPYTQQIYGKNANRQKTQ